MAQRKVKSFCLHGKLSFGDHYEPKHNWNILYGIKTKDAF
jgi:hypothetical protein